MAATDQRLRDEIGANFDYFQRTLATHLRAHAGQFALLKGRRVYGFFDSVGEADLAGWRQFSDRLYSIQQVTPEPVDLGLYADAEG